MVNELLKPVQLQIASVFEEVKNKYPDLDIKVALGFYIALQRAVSVQTVNPELAAQAHLKLYVGRMFFDLHTVRMN